MAKKGAQEADLQQIPEAARTIEQKNNLEQRQRCLKKLLSKPAANTR